MAGCCRSGVCEEMFNPRKARANLRRYRKKGLDKLERDMVLTAATQPLTGARILEIGGGIGTIQAELVASGASNGEIVELVSAYEPYARELARDKGIEGRSHLSSCRRSGTTWLRRACGYRHPQSRGVLLAGWYTPDRRRRETRRAHAAGDLSP